MLSIDANIENEDVCADSFSVRSMSKEDIPIVIVGGGIGGLCLASALSRQGIEVCVLEQAPQYQPLGAGITMQINAMQALKCIGLADRVVAEGNALSQLVVRFSNGKPVFTSQVSKFAEEFNAPFLGILRASLHQTLLDALPAELVTMGCTVEDVQENDNFVTLLTNQGSKSASAVIGADGIKSSVRASLWGKEPLRYAGMTSWRGVLDNPNLTPQDQAGEYWGANNVFGYVPLNDGKLYWFATQRAAAGGQDQGDPRDHLLSMLKGWSPPIEQWIEDTRPDSILRTDIYDRPPRFPWGKGRCTLLGDAAHPMTPNLGQGGCQAVEDAVILSHELQKGSSPEAAFRVYESFRRVRTERIVRDSRRFSSLAHGDTLFMRIARNWIFPILPASFRERQLRQLCEFRME